MPVKIKDRGRPPDASQQAFAPAPASVARKCLAQAEGDWKAAAALMTRRAADDAALRTALLDAAIWYAIRHAAASARPAYFRREAAEESDLSKRGLRLMAARNMYDYPLMGGLRLGDATREDLAENIAKHEADAATNAKKAAWLTSVSRHVTEDKRVRECLDSEALERLAEAAGL